MERAQWCSSRLVTGLSRGLVVQRRAVRARCLPRQGLSRLPLRRAGFPACPRSGGLRSPVQSETRTFCAGPPFPARLFPSRKRSEKTLWTAPRSELKVRVSRRTQVSDGASGSSQVEQRAEHEPKAGAWHDHHCARIPSDLGGGLRSEDEPLGQSGVPASHFLPSARFSSEGYPQPRSPASLPPIIAVAE